MQLQFCDKDQKGDNHYYEYNEGTDQRYASLKLYNCEFCEYTSNNQHHVFRHRRIHTQERPFKCDLCFYSSTQKTNLIRHKNVHSCGMCEFRSGDKFVLQRHRQSFHKQWIIQNYICKWFIFWILNLIIWNIYTRPSSLNWNLQVLKIKLTIPSRISLLNCYIVIETLPCLTIFLVCWTKAGLNYVYNLLFVKLVKYFFLFLNCFLQCICQKKLFFDFVRINTIIIC